MKNILVILCLLLTCSAVVANDIDYEQVYRDLPEADFSYVHNVDPGELYDTQSTSWSPYPLFRLTSPLFFKSTTIEPGYYLLTPRQHKGNWYILFKEQGKVKYIIPAYNREIVPMGFYDENLPKAKLITITKIPYKILRFYRQNRKKFTAKTCTKHVFGNN